jgi:REP element-mobilizing transposase RayT
LINDIRPKLYQHLLDNAKEKDIVIDTLGIQNEHIHMLIHLRSDQKIDDIVKLLKGESSHWINAENLIRPKFSWKRGYGAFSVSSSHVKAVGEYIQNQEDHHKKKTYEEEMISILRKYGFESDELDI